MLELNVWQIKRYQIKQIGSQGVKIASMRLHFHPTWTHTRYWTTHLLKKFRRGKVLISNSTLIFVWHSLQWPSWKINTHLFHLENIQCIFFSPFHCVIKMTNDTHLRTRDIFASSLKHALMYSILYKHAVSACMNYVYRQKLHTNGFAWLLPCCLFFSAASSTEEKDYVRWETEIWTWSWLYKKKKNRK